MRPFNHPRLVSNACELTVPTRVVAISAWLRKCVLEGEFDDVLVQTLAQLDGLTANGTDLCRRGMYMHIWSMGYENAVPACEITVTAKHNHHEGYLMRGWVPLLLKGTWADQHG
jgi:hypothetical protein